MGKPSWVTEDGNLGKIEEGVYYQLSIEATDPDGGDVTFSVISGYLSPGLALDLDGSIYGEPRLYYEIEGVPYDVNKDVTSSFCIRATASDGKISDRTFSLTVTGQDTPIIETAKGNLATILTGEYTEIQIETADNDLEPLTYKIIKGSLPNGMSLDTITGKIFGYPLPYVSDYDAAQIGFDMQVYGIDWDITQPTNAHKNYEFVLQLSDGKEKTNKVFSILVLSKSLLRADSTYYTVDGTEYVTTDMDTVHDPLIVTKDTDLGIYEHNNYFAYKFEATDIDNEPLSFEIESGSLPPGVELDAVTGWVYGYIPNQTLSQTEYTVNVRAYKTNYPTYKSDTVELKITVVSNLYNAINWITPSDLGTIDTGELCNIAIESTNTANLKVSYYIYPRENTGNPGIDFEDYNSYNINGGQLPQGLVFQSNGLLIGRPSFEYTIYDSNDTTFDINSRQVGVRAGETTFDREFKFTVVAESLNGEVRAQKEFKLAVASRNHEPYESVYLRSNITADKYWHDIVFNTDIFPQTDIYRNSDPNFGIRTDARMLLLGGLSAKSSTALMEALDKNHYRKVLKFGKPQIAKSYLLDKTVEYEVIYYDIVDDQNTGNQDTISSSIDLSQQINTEVIDYESKIPNDAIVYPNSLEGMRSRLISSVGLASNSEVLPNWMKNRQPDGSIIGWKPVVVLAYMKPGTGERALFNLKRRTDIVQRNISFDVDRYVLDNNLSKTYDNENEEYYDSEQTTFDSIASIASTPVATVDFAVEVPFSSLHGKTTAQINAAGGLDQIITAYQDKLIIFAKQENFTFAEEDDKTGEFEAVDGWLKTTTFYDSPDGFDATAQNFDAGEVIPGYQEFSADPSITNQRAGVWKFVKDTETQLWFLEFQSFGRQTINYDDSTKDSDDGLTKDFDLDFYTTEVDAMVLFDGDIQTPNINYNIVTEKDDNNKDKQVLKVIKENIPDETEDFDPESFEVVVIAINWNVIVNGGKKYGGKVLQYTNDIETGNTVPNYEIAESIDDGIATTFDNNNTKFINQVIVYQIPDVDDTFLPFPKTNIWE